MSSPPKLPYIDVSVDTQQPSIAILTFNRPQSANALTTPLVQNYLSALQWAERTAEIRIILTTGSGKFFTAGLDLLHPSIKSSPAEAGGGGGEESATISTTFLNTLSQIHTHLIHTPKLIVSAVNGPAVGWGSSYLALSDLVYASPDEAIFFTPFTQWGFSAEGCSSYTFGKALGRQKAAALILGGARFSAEEMERAGLVTQVMRSGAREGFWEEVLGIVREIAQLPPETLRVNKELMMRGKREALVEANEVEMRVLKEMVRKKESLDAVQAFAEATERKRKAKEEKKRSLESKL